MSNTLVVKQLKDGSGRLCIHWLVRDDAGPIKLLDVNVPTPYPKGKQARIACNKEQNAVTPQQRGQEVFLCLRTDEIRAVTCPACLATNEAKLAFAEIAEREEQPLSTEDLQLLNEAATEAGRMVKKIAV